MVTHKYSVAFLFLLICATPLFADECSEAKTLVQNGAKLADASAKEEDFYKQALQKCPELSEAQYNLALIELKRGNIANAQDMFERLVAKERRTDFLLALAGAKIKNSDIDGAKQLYAEVLEKDKKNIAALQGLAFVYDKSGDATRAIEYLKEAADVSPSDALIYFNLAVIYDKENKINDALKMYEHALSYESDNYNYLLFAGLCYKKNQQYTEAIRNLTKAVAINHDGVAAYKALGIIYDHEKNYDKSELAFDRVVQLDPADIDSKLNLAVAKIRKKQFSQAEELLHTIDREKSDDKQRGRIYSVLGWVQLESGKYKEAEKSLQEALKINSMDKAANNNLNALYKIIGKGQD